MTEGHELGRLLKDDLPKAILVDESDMTAELVEKAIVDVEMVEDRVTAAGNSYGRTEAVSQLISKL